MKKQILILILLALSYISYSQTCLISDFSFGGTEEEGLFGVMDAIEDVGVGYIVFTVSSSMDGDVMANNINTDGWIYKVDYDGNILWSKTYGDAGYDYIYNVVEDNDGNFVVVGGSNSNIGSFSGNQGESDLWVFKIDPMGNLIWNKLFGGTRFDSGRNIIIDDNGNYLISAFTLSFDGDISSYIGYGDIWMVKLDNMGSLIWEKNFGGHEDESAWDLVNDSFSNNTLVVGTSYSTTGDVSNGSYSGDIWVFKIDDSGNLLWEKSYGGLGYEIAYKVIQLTNGNYLLAGFSGSSDGDIQNGNQGDADAAVIMIDSIGNLISFKNYGGSLFETFTSIVPLNNVETVFVGYSKSSDGDVNNNYGDNDIWYTKINNTTGSIIKSQNFGGSKDDSGPKALLSSDNNFMIISSATSIDYDVNSRANDDTQGDIWMFEYNPNYVYSNTISLKDNNTLEVMNESDSYQWIDCSDESLISGEISKEFNPISNGNYAAITTKGNCLDTTACVEFNINSIENESASSLIEVYPNPIGKSDYLKIVADVKILDVVIYNSIGVNMSYSYSKNDEISIKELPNGVYYLHINIQEGRVIKKILKI